MGGAGGMETPMGAGGVRDGDEHERSTWLTEDEDFWAATMTGPRHRLKRRCSCGERTGIDRPGTPGLPCFAWNLLLEARNADAAA